jgi:CubicO group peptidase (beta-lactamase class C family)
MSLDEFLTRTVTTALLVVVDGTVVVEQYLAGTRTQDRLLGNSATKSALALLVGRAVDDGLLPDLDTPVTALVPELRASGYAGVSLRQLLTMTSGVGWREDYHDPASPASRLLRRWHEGAGGLRESLLDMAPGDPPGSRYAYCTPDSLALDWARERATGQTFAAALNGLWPVIEAEHPALVGLDRSAEQGGIAMAGGSLAATARDWARIGTLQIDGSWAGRQVVSRSWVEASCRPEQEFLAPGRLPSTITTHAGFGYHWWPLDRDGERVMADGMRGQFVYVDRPRRIVIVKTSAWPYADAWWDRQCRDLCYLALPAIADAAAAAFARTGGSPTGLAPDSAR